MPRLMPSVRIRRTAAVTLVLAAALALPASAKMRAVRSGLFTAPPPVSNDCHTFGLVRPGLKASYFATAPGGNATFTITYISDTPTQLRSTQTVQTAQGNATAETTVDGELIGNLRALKHIFVRTTTVVPVLGSLVVDTDIDFVPSLAMGPADGWCTGKTWQVAPVTQTITTRSISGTNVIVNQLIGTEGKVLGVGVDVTVPAGTFKTVQYQSAIVSGTSVQPAITWMSMEHHIAVKQQTLDATGNVISTTELTALQW